MGKYVNSLMILDVHPRKLIWNRKMMVVSRNLLFQGFIFRFHVSFRGCIQLVIRLFSRGAVVDLAIIKNPQVIEGIVCKHPLSIRLHGFPSWKNAGDFFKPVRLCYKANGLGFFWLQGKSVENWKLSEQG